MENIMDGVERLINKEINLISERIDGKEDHQREVKCLVDLLEARAKDIQADRDFQNASEKSANADRELKEKLEAAEFERDMKLKEFDLKQREHEHAVHAEVVEEKAKRDDALIRKIDIAVRNLVTLTGVGLQLGGALYLVREGFKFEETGHYASSPTLRWCMNAVPKFKL